MKKIVLGIAGVAALAMSTAGLAGGPDSYTAAPSATSATGVYVGGGIGYGENQLPTIPTGSGFSKDQSGIGFLGYVGYQFTKNLAVEAGYVRPPRTDITNAAGVYSTGAIGAPVLVTPRAKTKLDSHIFYLALKGIYPVTNNFDIFVKGGVGRWYGDALVLNQTSSVFMGVATGAFGKQSRERYVFVGGVGADYYLTQNLALTGQVFGSFKDAPAPGTLLGTVGVTYKFAV